MQIGLRPLGDPFHITWMPGIPVQLLLNTWMFHLRQGKTGTNPVPDIRLLRRRYELIGQVTARHRIPQLGRERSIAQYGEGVGIGVLVTFGLNGTAGENGQQNGNNQISHVFIVPVKDSRV